MTADNKIFNKYKSITYGSKILQEQSKLFTELRLELENNIHSRELGEATLLIIDEQIERCRSRTSFKTLRMIKDLIKYKMEDLL
jgi:hypothetical protein